MHFIIPFFLKQIYHPEFLIVCFRSFWPISPLLLTIEIFTI